jgi:hypothetical protein
VKVRLDRVVANPSWLICFPDYRLHHLASSRSDHYPLILSVGQPTDARPERPQRRYEVLWEREPSLPAAVEEVWSRRVPIQNLGDVNEALRGVMLGLYG